MKKKIAFIHDVELEIDSRAQKEVSSLLRNGHSVLFCGWNKRKSGKNEKFKEEYRKQLVNGENICIQVKKGKGFKDNIFSLIKYEFKLFSWLYSNRKQYDYIHACNFDVAFASVLFAKIFNKKVIYDIYDDYADSHSCGKCIYIIIKKLDGFVIKNVQKVIICSEKRREQLAFKPRNINIIHNSPDIEDIDSNLMPIEENSRLKIVYVGNLDNGRFIVELANIISKYKEYELHCGGAGIHEDTILELANKCENIFFYGRLSYDKVLSLESNCDVIPALYDPTIKNHKFAAPNKFYEALYLGKPTIMFHNTGMDDIVDKEYTGITIDFSEESLEDALSKINENIKVWKANSKRLKEVYNNSFKWENMEKRLFDLYDSI